MLLGSEILGLISKLCCYRTKCSKKVVSMQQNIRNLLPRNSLIALLQAGYLAIAYQSVATVLRKTSDVEFKLSGEVSAFYSAHLCIVIVILLPIVYLIVVLYRNNKLNLSTVRNVCRRQKEIGSNNEGG